MKNKQNNFKEQLETLLSAPVNDIDLNDCRTLIDTIDHELLGLLQQRMQIVKRVGEIKEGQGLATKNKSFIRPAREANLIREVYNQHDLSYPPELLLTLWRNILSASVSSEQALRLGVIESELHTFWYARESYGSFIESKGFNTYNDLFSAIVNNHVQVAICSKANSVDPWWIALKDFSAQKQLYVFSKHPFIKTKRNPFKFFSVAHIDLEPSGEDHSLFYVKIAEQDAIEPFLAICQQSSIRIMERVENQFLCDVPEFCQELVTFAPDLKNKGLTDMIYLGSYPKPIKVVT